MRPATPQGWEAVNRASRAVKDYALHDQVVAPMWTAGAVLSALREKSKDTSEAARVLVTISPMPSCTGFSAKDSGSSGQHRIAIARAGTASLAAHIDGGGPSRYESEMRGTPKVRP